MAPLPQKLSLQGQDGESRKAQANGVHIKIGQSPERKEDFTMAKITIAGDSIVIAFGKTLDQIKDLEKYRPKALCLFETDEDGNKVEVFRVASGTTGIINMNGAVFASVTHDDQKLATITMPIPTGTPNAVDYAAEKIGVAITMLNRVEAQFDEAIAAVAAEKAAVRECITVAC